MSVNACALGQHTTKGAMKTFSEEELKAILSHEVAHILNMDTMALIYTMIGNGIFTAIIVMVKTVYWLVSKIEQLENAVRIADGIFSAITTAFFFLMQIALAVSDRKAERRADEYATTLGYGEDMVEALYLLEENLCRAARALSRSCWPAIRGLLTGLRIWKLGWECRMGNRGKDK
ncbi:MAG: M48 family metalloprotease [Oscillospiraceae bacterium]|jgi:Zn-dependent protease with chaperone function|nr:M48 family metalloprotease [Oscillospiraceae bacterium]